MITAHTLLASKLTYQLKTGPFITRYIAGYLLKDDVKGAPGSGVGKGGGGGGAVRESGGSLGEYGAVQEEEYFYRKQRDQLDKIKKKKMRKTEKTGSEESQKGKDDK